VKASKLIRFVLANINLKQNKNLTELSGADIIEWEGDFFENR